MSDQGDAILLGEHTQLLRHDTAALEVDLDLAGLDAGLLVDADKDWRMKVGQTSTANLALTDQLLHSSPQSCNGSLSFGEGINWSWYLT